MQAMANNTFPQFLEMYIGIISSQQEKVRKTFTVGPLDKFNKKLLDNGYICVSPESIYHKGTIEDKTASVIQVKEFRYSSGSMTEILFYGENSRFQELTQDVFPLPFGELVDHTKFSKHGPMWTESQLELVELLKPYVITQIDGLRANDIRAIDKSPPPFGISMELVITGAYHSGEHTLLIVSYLSELNSYRTKELARMKEHINKVIGRSE